MSDEQVGDKLLDSNLPWREKRIGEHVYRVTRLDWWRVNDVVTRLADILGPSLEGVGTDIPLGALLDVDTAEILPALVSALGRATGERGQELQAILGIQTYVEDGDRTILLDKARMGIWFSQHPKEALLWLLFALEVQVKDFFEPLIGAAPTPRSSQKSAPTPRAKAAATAKGRKSRNI